MRAALLATFFILATNARSARAEELRFAVYARSAADYYSSAARTIGGVGGAIGMRATSDILVLQTDLGILTGLGTVFAWNLGAGAQARFGSWTPMLLGTVSLLAGDQIRFLSERRTLPISGPAAWLGIDLEPLRFTDGRTAISALALGAGLGSDFPELGLALHLVFFDLSSTF